MIATAVLHYFTLHWVELAGWSTTLLGIWLTTRRNLLCWPITLAADILYLVVFYRARLLSDALLQVFFVAFTFYGWWHWWRGVQEEGEVRIEPLPKRSLWIALIAGAAGTIVLGALAKQLQAAVPYLDALLTSFSLVASLVAGAQAHRQLVAVDRGRRLYIGEYIYKDLWPTAILYAILVALAALGLRNWKRAQRPAVVLSV